MKWRPITSAPHDGTYVLVGAKDGWHPGNKDIAAWRTFHPNAKGKAEWRTFDGTRLTNITHWMPLPKGP